MSRFSQIGKGFAAIKSVEFPRVNHPHGIQKDQPELADARARDGASDEPVMVGLLPLDQDADDEVDRLAELYSKSKGVEQYNDTHPICVKARMVYTLATACVDPTSDPRRPLPFFDRAAPELSPAETIEQRAEIVRTLTPDVIVYLHEQWQIWQDKIHPQALTIADTELAAMAKKAAESEDFLLSLRPGLRLRLLHFMAALAQSVLEANYGTSFGESTTTTKPSSKPRRNEKRTQARKTTKRRK